MMRYRIYTHSLLGRRKATRFSNVQEILDWQYLCKFRYHWESTRNVIIFYVYLDYVFISHTSVSCISSSVKYFTQAYFHISAYMFLLMTQIYFDLFYFCWFVWTLISRNVHADFFWNTFECRIEAYYAFASLI